MLKLNASYFKEVPAEGEYSSQSYHASIEVELSDGLSQDQLNAKIHETWAVAVLTADFAMGVAATFAAIKLIGKMMEK